MTTDEQDELIEGLEKRISSLEKSGGRGGGTYVTIAGLGWFTLAFINAGLGKALGSSALKWFLLSLFMGPCATCCIVSC